MLRYILTDIEGTTTPIVFVHKTLFPYARARLRSYVAAHAADPVVVQALADVRATVRREEEKSLDQEGVLAQLETWIDKDRKHPALKTLQGLIWEHGYVEGAYQGEVYADVPPALAAWRERGLGIGIYSSGSVAAQKLLFGYSNHGDLTPYFSHYFDTAVGAKREAVSYGNILKALKLPGAAVLFLSDVPEELVAARAEGMQTVQLVRAGTVAAAGERTARDFREVEALMHGLGARR